MGLAIYICIYRSYRYNIYIGNGSTIWINRSGGFQRRSPLSRFGDLNIFNANPFSGWNERGISGISGTSSNSVMVVNAWAKSEIYCAGEARYRMGRTLPSTFGQAHVCVLKQYYQTIVGSRYVHAAHRDQR